MASESIIAQAATSLATNLLNEINAQRSLFQSAQTVLQGFNQLVGVGSGPPPDSAPTAQLIWLDQDAPALYVRPASGAWSLGLEFNVTERAGVLSLDFASLGNLYLV